MKTQADNLPHASRGKRWAYNILHLIILCLSLYLIITISIDTFHNVAFYNQSKFMHIQNLICYAFLADFFIELVMAEKGTRWRYVATHFLFLLVSIPYLEIINHFGWTFSEKVGYLLRFVPLVRGGYALAIVVGWFTYNRATSLFVTYVVTLLATIYFGSLVFYVFEKGVNPLVKDYYSALWWGFMDATTVGSNIVAVTPVGRVLSVLLAALGMMMFPIFTVYVTNIIQNRNRSDILVPFVIPSDNDRQHGDKTPSAHTDSRNPEPTTPA